VSHSPPKSDQCDSSDRRHDAGSISGFGLTVSGLPGQWPVSCDGENMSAVEWSTARSALRCDAPWWHREEADGFVIGWKDEAEYSVGLSPRPRIAATDGGIGERDAAIMGIVSVLPLALPLFGLEPLHGSAVRVGEGGALLVLGPSEAGKSTTAKLLRQAGMPFVADDACAIDSSGMLWPGPPLLAARVARAGERALATYDGKSIDVVRDHSVRPMPVHSVVVLQPGPVERMRLEPKYGKEAFTALLSQVRSPWLMTERRRELQLMTTTTLTSANVAVLVYEHGRHSPERVCEAVVDWVTS
jgi:hypothetical protein